MCIYMGVRKFGPFQFKKKSRNLYIFFFKKLGDYHIPGRAVKGGYLALTSVL